MNIQEEILNVVDADRLRTDLREADVVFGNRSGPARLIELAVDAEVTLYDAAGEELEVEVQDDELVLIDADADDAEDDAEGEGTEGEIEAADEAEDEPEGGNIVPEKYRQKYGTAQHCGDEVATVFKDFVTVDHPDGKGRTMCSETAMIQVCDQNGVDYGKWDHLNMGQRRMNLGNVLRARVKRGERVQIGKRVWEAVEKTEDDGDARASKMG